MKHLSEALSKSQIKKIKKNDFDARNIIFLLPTTIGAIEHLKHFVSDDSVIYSHPAFFILNKENALLAIDEIKKYSLGGYYLFRLTNPEKYNSFIEIKKDIEHNNITVKYPGTKTKNTVEIAYHQIMK